MDDCLEICLNQVQQRPSERLRESSQTDVHPKQLPDVPHVAFYGLWWLTRVSSCRTAPAPADGS